MVASASVGVWLNHLLAEGNPNTVVAQPLSTVVPFAEGAGVDDGFAAKTTTVSHRPQDASSWAWEACSW